MTYLPVLLVIAAAPIADPSVPVPRPECRQSEGNLACGFHCKAGLGIAKCAQTPDGFCETIEGEVLCWDPPEVVRQHPPKKPTVGVCRSKYRAIACGYACETSPTQIACAATPYGVCLAKFDQVKCWDPPEAVIHLLAPNLPAAKCLATTQEIACGYDCKSTHREVACAQTPGGRCVINDGKIACWDPPLPQNPGHTH